MANDNNKLDNPLVVHKETDASFQDVNEENDITAGDVTITHYDEEQPTLERHRFKKVKKKKKYPYVILILVIVIVVIVSLMFAGVIPNPFVSDDDGDSAEVTTEETTEEVNEFEGIITVKGTYLFYEGEEINGSEELIRKIKYLDPEEKSFIVQDEDADSTFLNDEILPVLENYGFEYEVKFIISSGLVSENETTTEAESADEE